VYERTFHQHHDSLICAQLEAAAGSLSAPKLYSFPVYIRPFYTLRKNAVFGVSPVCTVTYTNERAHLDIEGNWDYSNSDSDAVSLIFTNINQLILY
jgi:hypothetical protein